MATKINLTKFGMRKSERAYMVLNDIMNSWKNPLERNYYAVPVMEDHEMWFYFLSEPTVTTVFGCRITSRRRLKISLEQVIKIIKDHEVSADEFMAVVDIFNSKLKPAAKNHKPFPMTLQSSKFGAESAFRLLCRYATN